MGDEPKVTARPNKKRTPAIDEREANPPLSADAGRGRQEAGSGEAGEDPEEKPKPIGDGHRLMPSSPEPPARAELLEFYKLTIEEYRSGARPLQPIYPRTRLSGSTPQRRLASASQTRSCGMGPSSPG